jgi:CheY-like chemotaxis protein
VSRRLNRTREAGLERALRRRRPEPRFRAPRTWSRRNQETRYWAAPETPDTRATSDERILIVDDESAIRLICRLNLGSSGFETFEAGDGDTAVAVARAERPDLILLDVMLPGKDGWEVAEELAAVDGTREIPILFLSARSDRTDESRGYELGGVGYITKPFDPHEMIERVRHVLTRVRRGERDELRDEWRDRIRHD